MSVDQMPGIACSLAAPREAAAAIHATATVGTRNSPTEARATSAIAVRARATANVARRHGKTSGKTASKAGTARTTSTPPPSLATRDWLLDEQLAEPDDDARQEDVRTTGASARTTPVAAEVMSVSRRQRWAVTDWDNAAPASTLPRLARSPAGRPHARLRSWRPAAVSHRSGECVWTCSPKTTMAVEYPGRSRLFVLCLMTTETRLTSMSVATKDSVSQSARSLAFSSGFARAMSVVLR